MSPESNSRRKFVELAEKRVTKTIKDIRLIGNLSNRSNYAYTDRDAQKIYRRLKSELDAMKQRFESKGESTSIDFRLESDAE